MENAIHTVEALAESIKEYINTRLESVKFTTAEKSSAVIANISAAIIAGILILLVLLFASIGLAMAINSWEGSAWKGFEYVALLYLVVGLFVWFFRGKIIRLPILNTMIQLLITEDEKDK